MRYVTVCFYHSQLLITVQGRVTVLVFSFRLYITCCTVCSRFVFVCNFPSLHLTAAILVTQSVWSKLHLHVLQLCTVCWQTAEMWLFAIPTWWVTNHSAGVRRNPSAMRWISPCLCLCLAWEIRRSRRDMISVVLNSPPLWGFSAVCKWTSSSPLPPCLVIWLRLCQWIWAVFTVKAFISVLAGEGLLNNQSVTQAWNSIKP